MAGLVSICCCAGGRLMSLGRPSPSLLLIVLFWRVLNVVCLVSICRCNDGRFASFRKAFGPLLYPLVFLSIYFPEGAW